MTLLACQHDAYRRSMTAAILDVLPVDGGVEVILADTVLYPEGGGQPDDHGTLDGQPVLGLRKTDRGVAHRIAARPEGESAEVVLDWTRRLDHMQQHTAQHLISAIAADRFSADTTAFHLRDGLCDIDLSRSLSRAEADALQAAVNAEIRAARAVGAVEVAAADLDDVRCRKLPDGLTGPVRLVEIDGIDRNTCGGTHVASTAELQAVVLLPPLSHKGGCKLRYLAGGRVTDGLSAAHDRETTLSRALSCGSDQHAEAIKRMQAEGKAAARVQKALQMELSGLLGGELARSEQAHLHRDDADLGFLRGVAAAAAQRAPGRLFVLTGGTDGGAGVFMLIGPAEAVAALGPEVAMAVTGRGGGAKGRYQGKAQALDLAAVSALV
ncbi:MAG: alanyl-tRNA editing protein [Myxococcota bacterium]|nr:alanyl-tRNA editing protein [Myxococcota bacterium]